MVNLTASAEKLEKVLDSFSSETKYLTDKTGPSDLAKVGKWYDEESSSDPESALKSNQLERICKTILHCSVIQNDEQSSMSKICRLLDSVLYLSSDSKCEYSLTHLLIEELLDIQTIEWCQEFWHYMVSREAEIANNLAGNKAPGTTLIRLCNSLVKRLSKTRDVQFSGQIAMFLARAFPISEKSGLNIRGTFNTDNITTFEEDKKEQENKDDDGDEDLINKDFKSDESLYSKFWSIQEVFADPTVVFSQEKLDELKRKITDVLGVLRDKSGPPSSKDRRMNKRQRGKYEQEYRDGGEMNNDNEEEEEGNMFVPKWLTRRDLFELQLKDTTFRRTIMIQIFIITNFLLSLSAEEKAKWGSEYKAVNRGVLFSYTLTTGDKLFFENIQKTLNSGNEFDQKFMATLWDIFGRDKNWQIWKLQSCPSFEFSPVDPENYTVAQKNLEKNKQPRKKYWHAMGTPGLTKVWKIGTGLQYLRNPEKYTIPTAESYYRRIEQLTQEKKDLGDGMSEEKSDGSRQREEEIEGVIESSTWRGLRAARDQGYWIQFGYVDREKGFSGLFMTPEEREEYAKKKRLAAAANATAKADTTIGNGGEDDGGRKRARILDDGTENREEENTEEKEKDTSDNNKENKEMDDDRREDDAENNAADEEQQEQINENTAGDREQDHSNGEKSAPGSRTSPSHETSDNPFERIHDVIAAEEEPQEVEMVNASPPPQADE